MMLIIPEKQEYLLCLHVFNKYQKKYNKKIQKIRFIIHRIHIYNKDDDQFSYKYALLFICFGKIFLKYIRI